MFVTSRQLDRLLFVSIALTTGAFAQTTVLFLVMVAPLEVARCCGLDVVIVILNVVLIAFDIFIVLICSVFFLMTTSGMRKNPNFQKRNENSLRLPLTPRVRVCVFDVDVTLTPYEKK
jgi:hypothetical protein